MTSRPVRVLIVDDSASMRAMVGKILSADPEIEVVGSAPEPHAARALIKEVDPDVITLDVEMPGMDGLSFLEKIMRLRPMPVVMLSTLTARGTDVTIEALRLGAVDCIAKPNGGPASLMQEAEAIRETVKTAGRSARPRRPEKTVPAKSGRPLRDDIVIGIGSSTGGVEALFSLLGGLPVDCPPIMIVQHMPPAFTSGFADRLERYCAIRVVEAKDGMLLEKGTAYVAPGGRHMELTGAQSRPRIRLHDADPMSGHRPSVDMLFNSLAPLGPNALGVILTGMGSDGAHGLLEMRQAGARTLGQDEASCVVYGMPRAAFLLGAVQQQFSLNALPGAILKACQPIYQEH